MNTFGILAGLLTLVLIGLGFLWVILGERYFSYLWWPYVVIAGVALLVGSLFISSDWLSLFSGVLGGSTIWGATELKAQAMRSKLGWFPFRAKKIMPPLAELIRKIPYPKI